MDAILRSADLVAVLGRDVPVRLIDISGSGCLLESDYRVATGTAGSLRVRFNGTEYTDDVRVMWCRSRNGSTGGFHLGAEFLWTTSPGAQSLRRVLTMIQPDSFEPASLGPNERM